MPSTSGRSSLTTDGSEPDPKPRFSGTSTCLGCGCLCDDVGVEFASDEEATFLASCDLGRRWFQTALSAGTTCDCEIDGTPADPSVALGEVIRVLTDARRPVIFGLTEVTTESVRSAIALADRLKAAVVLDRSRAELDRLAAFQERGRVSATLGEVKARADVLVYWGGDPVRTHPRHAERYAFETTGRFVPEGRAGRTVIVIAEEPNETAQIADLFIQVPAGRQVELGSALRQLVRSPSAGLARLAKGCGIDPATLSELAVRLRAARYGALFFDFREPSSGLTRIAWESAVALVRTLNETTRFVLMNLGRGGNAVGAESALAWQTGLAQNLDFGQGFPAPLDDLVTLDEMLGQREVDALLTVGDGWTEQLSPESRAQLSRLPVVCLRSGRAASESPRTRVVLYCSTPGIDESGTVTRPDGVVLPLRPLRNASRPSAKVWLDRLLEQLGEQEGRCSTS